MKKKVKKYYLIGIGMIFVVSVLVLTYAFKSQWNLNGYSKKINVEICSGKGFQKIYFHDANIVYTYDLGECYTTMFLSGKRVDLEEILGEGLSLRDITGCMKKEKINELIVYCGENYQLIQIGTNYIICDLSLEVEIVKEEFEKIIDKR